MYSLPLFEEDKKEILRKLRNQEFSDKEMQEIWPLFPYLGLQNQSFIVDDAGSPKGLMIKEYLEFHKRLPENYQKIPIEEIKIMGNSLFDASIKEIEKRKEIIILLAHHGTIEALEILEKYLEQVENEELAFWTQVAIDECKTFLESDIMEKPVTRITKI